MFYSVYGCTYKCIHIYIYTHTNTSICLYVYLYVYVNLCVISKVGFFKEKYYFTVKIEMMVFNNFVPVIVKCVQFWLLFFCLGCKYLQNKPILEEKEWTKVDLAVWGLRTDTQLLPQ